LACAISSLAVCFACFELKVEIPLAAIV
jgi:hypothetical protein